MTPILAKECPHIRIFCDIGETGYGVATRGYLDAFKTLGIGPEKIRCIPVVTGTPTNQLPADDIIQPYCFGEWTEEDRINIVHLNPGMVGSKHTTIEGRYNIAVCAWETNQLPKVKYQRAGATRTVLLDLNDYDEIWVPTNFVKEVFVKEGVERPVFVIPHALRERFLKIPVPNYPQDIKNVILYFIGSWNARKNVETLIRAYWACGWDPTDRVRLALHLLPDMRDERSIERHAGLVKYGIEQLKKATPGQKAQLTPLLLPVSYHALATKIHAPAHALVTASRGEGACLLPRTFVDTKVGPVPIENINFGDHVVTHAGHLQYVSNITGRIIKDDIIVGIRRLGCDQIFWGTKEHPHLIIRRKRRRFATVRESIKNGEKPEWIPLGQVCKGDFVAIPKPNWIKILPSVDKIVLEDWIDNLKKKSGKVFLSMSYKINPTVSLTDIAQKAGCAFQTVSKVLKSKNNSMLARKIRKIAKELGYTDPEHVYLPSVLDLDSYMMIFMGLYLADGWHTPRGIGLCLNSKEQWGRMIVRKIASKIGIKLTERYEEGKSVFYLSSSILAKLFFILFNTGAKNKRIPLCFYNHKSIKYLLKGFFCGDGTVGDNRYKFNTSSHGLAFDLFQICAANDILLHTQISKRDENITLIVAECHEKSFYNWVKPRKYSFAAYPVYAERYTKSNRRQQHIIETSKYFFTSIKSLQKKKYRGMVYNLHVEEDESYTCYGMATHNCLPAIEGAAMRSYVIGGAGPALDDLAKHAPGVVTVLPRTEIPITPMPECQGYESDQTWWETAIVDLKDEMRAIEEFIRTEGMPEKEEAEAVREAYSPTAIGKLIAPRLEHAINVLEKTGW